jgi:hypothetical protein
LVELREHLTFPRADPVVRYARIGFLGVRGGRRGGPGPSASVAGRDGRSLWCTHTCVLTMLWVDHLAGPGNTDRPGYKDITSLSGLRAVEG